MIRECADCHREMRHYARGLCRTCHRRRTYAGTREARAVLRAASSPPLIRKQDALARFEDYVMLRRSQGEMRQVAARRVGVSERTAWRYEAQLRVQEAAA